MTNAMTAEMRKTGIEVVGNMSWGTHFCLFYDTKADLLETLVSYCKAGLESQEFCLWVVAPPVTVEDARQALKEAILEFDQYIADSSIEIVAAHDWYLHDGSFDLKRVIAGWNQKLMRASAKGYAGVRVTGDTAWLEKKDWKDFCEYEESLNEAIANQRLAVLCTYPLAACGAAEILDVVRTHQFAVTKRRGNWDIVETAGHKQAKAEIKRLNEELELRVIERTRQLTAVNEELTREVLERQRAEEALRRSEGYLAEAQRLSHTGSWASRPDAGEVLYFSEECYRVLGFDPNGGQPGYEGFFQRVHPDDQPKLKKAVETAGRENVEFEMDYRFIRPDGEVIDIHVIGHPVPSSRGDDIVEFVGTVMDVTERRRADVALRRSEAYLAEAQRLTHTGSWAYSIGSKELIHSSEEHSRLFGFDRERGVPSFEELIQRIHPDERAPSMQRFESQVRAETDFDGHFRIVHPDGTTKYVYSTGHPVFNASGDIVEFVGTVMDITERKRAEEERERLRQAQADFAHVSRVNTMGELTASLAHEVNQPIAAAVTSANACVRWLAGDTPNLEKARAAAVRIVKDGTHAAEIISRIRLLFEKSTAERESVDVNEVIREMIALLRGEATRYNVSVSTDLAADVPEVIGDRVQLQQVMMNLIMNSIDAMNGVDGAREITIKSQRAGNDQLQVSVSDTGVGLPPQQADQIFNAFFTTKTHGTGMGLRISRSIIESHDGSLWAADNSPRGAVFNFTLPFKVETHE